MIELRGVSKHYGRKPALIDVNLSLPKGKVIGVIGPNGSGKSTFLKLLAGITKPKHGIVTIDGEQVDRRIARKVAYLSERDITYSFFTVQEAIDYYSSQFNDFNKEKSYQIVDFLQLELNRKIEDLSKGNQGRVKITLSREVPYILLDEPLSGLDPVVRESIINGVISFVDLDWQTVILTTHEVDEIEPLLDIFVAFREGKLIEVMEIDALHENKKISLLQWMKKVYSDKPQLLKSV